MKVKKIAALIAAVVLILGICWFANGFLGNPVSWLLARSTAKKYLAEMHPGTDFQIESVSYSFKEGGYYAQIESPSSRDSYFSLRMDGWGQNPYSSYEEQVVNGGNTARRLDEEYRDMVDEVLENGSLPYKVFFAYGVLSKGYDSTMQRFDLPVLDVSILKLDKVYDVSALAAQCGNLVVSVEDETVTEERAAEIIRDIKKRMDEAGIGFNWMDFSLCYPREEGGGPIRDGSVDLIVVPYEEIREEDITRQVHRWAEETKSFYADMDKQK